MQKKIIQKIEDFHDLIPDHTYEWLQARTNLSYLAILTYCKKHNLKPKRKKRRKHLHLTTLKQLKKISKINTKQMTQKQLSIILRSKKNPLSRQATSIFLSKHKIEFKDSRQRSKTTKRLDKIKTSGVELKKMDMWDIADLLEFEGEYALNYTTRFLKKHNIEYK